MRFLQKKKRKKKEKRKTLKVRKVMINTSFNIFFLKPLRKLKIHHQMIVKYIIKMALQTKFDIILLKIHLMLKFAGKFQ